MKKGFTLIELMVVIVIMGILAAVAVPKIFGNVEKAKLSGVAETLAQFEQAVTTYYILNSGLPNSENDIDYNYAGGDGIVPSTPTFNTTSTVYTLTITTGECDGDALTTTISTTGTAALEATRSGDALTTAECAAKLTKVATGPVVLVD